MARQSSATLATAPAECGSLVAERAYYKAELRGFKPGHELDDWLAAEREVADLLAASEPAPVEQPAKRTTRRKNGAATPTKRT
jgi:DUF2934 family protein